MEQKQACFVRYKSSKVVYKAYEGMILHNFEPWHPQPDEYCWFWNDDKDFAFVAKFKTKTSLGYYALSESRKSPKDNCEPFFGILPSFLQ